MPFYIVADLANTTTGRGRWESRRRRFYFLSRKRREEDVGSVEIEAPDICAVHASGSLLISIRLNPGLLRSIISTMQVSSVVGIDTCLMYVK